MDTSGLLVGRDRAKVPPISYWHLVEAPSLPEMQKHSGVIAEAPPAQISQGSILSGNSGHTCETLLFSQVPGLPSWLCPESLVAEPGLQLPQASKLVMTLPLTFPEQSHPRKEPCPTITSGKEIRGLSRAREVGWKYMHLLTSSSSPSRRQRAREQKEDAGGEQGGRSVRRGRPDVQLLPTVFTLFSLGKREALAVQQLP